LKWISASEGAAFAKEIRVFVKELKELGETVIEE
jgi:coenzyme F420-reducing hydrogenase delta subunit